MSTTHTYDPEKRELSLYFEIADCAEEDGKLIPAGARFRIGGLLQEPPQEIVQQVADHLLKHGFEGFAAGRFTQITPQQYTERGYDE